MKQPKYTTNKREVYSLELEKLQRCLSELQHAREDASTLSLIGWGHIEHVRQMNFLLQQTMQTAEALLKIPG